MEQEPDAAFYAAAGAGDAEGGSGQGGGIAPGGDDGKAIAGGKQYSGDDDPNDRRELSLGDPSQSVAECREIQYNRRDDHRCGGRSASLSYQYLARCPGGGTGSANTEPGCQQRRRGGWICNLRPSVRARLSL